MRSALLISLILMSSLGCTQSRRYYLPDDQKPVVDLPPRGEAQAQLTFNDVKQQSDYLFLTFSILNQSKEIMRFKPPEAKDTSWGISMVPEGTFTVRRVSGGAESSLFIQPGQKAGFELFWRMEPEAPDTDWKWSLHIDGLMIGETVLEGMVIPAPKEAPRPVTQDPVNRLSGPLTH